MDAAEIVGLRSTVSLPLRFAVCLNQQALWRLARSGSAAPDALVIAQLQTRGATLGVALALLLVRVWSSSGLAMA